jgi:hypothetical protein
MHCIASQQTVAQRLTMKEDKGNHGKAEAKRHPVVA